jgi:hypothetical protein
VEWFTVTHRTLYSLAALCLLVGAIGFLGYRYHLSLKEVVVSAANDLGPSMATRQSAHFLEISGTVKVKRAGTWDYVSAQLGVPLGKGDQIRTVGKSTARVRLFDGTEYLVQPEAILVIEETQEDPQTAVRNVAVKLTSGQVNVSTARRNVAGSRTELATPTTETSFGELTQATVGYDEPRRVTALTVFQGESAVRAGGQQRTLKANERVEVLATRSFSEITRLPALPRVLSPRDHAQIVRSGRVSEPVTLNWEPVSGAQRYYVEVDRTASFIAPIHEQRVTGTKVLVPDLSTGSWFWRVRAIDSRNLEGGFTTARFSIVVQSADARPPALVVDEPEVSLEGLVVIRGKTDLDSIVVINDDRVAVSADGSFSTFLTLDGPGRHAIVVRAHTREGGAAEKTIYVKR